MEVGWCVEMLLVGGMAGIEAGMVEGGREDESEGKGGRPG